MKRTVKLAWILLAVIPFAAACQSSPDLQPKVDELSVENERLMKDNQDLSSRLASSESARGQLERQLRDKPAEKTKVSKDLGDGVTMEDKGREAVVRIPADIAFPSGVSDLSTKGQGVLDQVLGIIKKDYPNSTIRVEGHADTDPISKTAAKNHCNWDLAFKRAHSVMHYLTSKGGIDAKHITLASFGEHAPQDPANKAKNRRVEIVIVKN